jgi:hypothetical protein
MRTLYLRKQSENGTRKVLIDMAYLVAHKKIRLPKIYFEADLFLPYASKDDNQVIEKYFLTKDKIISEDREHYFFKFPFKPSQVENIAV